MTALRLRRPGKLRLQEINSAFGFVLCFEIRASDFEFGNLAHFAWDFTEALRNDSQKNEDATAGNAASLDFKGGFADDNCPSE